LTAFVIYIMVFSLHAFVKTKTNLETLEGI